MKKILDIAKYIGAVTVIASAALWFDAKSDNQVDMLGTVLDSVESVKDMVDYNNAEIYLMSEDVMKLQDTLDDFVEEQAKQGDNIKTLTWAVRNGHKYTQEQLDEVMDAMLKKNNTIVYSPILYPGPD